MCVVVRTWRVFELVKMSVMCVKMSVMCMKMSVMCMKMSECMVNKTCNGTAQKSHYPPGNHHASHF